MRLEKKKDFLGKMEHPSFAFATTRDALVPGTRGDEERERKGSTRRFFFRDVVVALVVVARVKSNSIPT